MDKPLWADVVYTPPKYTKYCFVPNCKNDSSKTPNKRFFHVPHKNKEEWCRAVGKAVIPKRPLVICKDHLDYSTIQMQEYGGSNKADHREGERAHQDYHHTVMQKGSYGCSNKDLSDSNMATYCRVATGIYEATAAEQQYQNQRYNNPSAPTFSSPPNSPLVGLVFDPSSPNYKMDRNSNTDRRSHSTWSLSYQEPIGTGAKKKIVKSQDKRQVYSADPRYHERYKDSSTETDRHKKQDRNLTSESTSSLDFFVEGERMVSELCNMPDSNARADANNQKSFQEEDKNKPSGSSDVLLTALDKIIIHDQIPNQIVQLAIEACTDAENIAIAHHNRPCFKNIHSICAKTRSNVQKPDSAVANLHSQGIPWVIKNFIFSFVRILDGWKGVKELLSEKHDTFSRIENKYYSPNIRECFVQWQAVTKEMLTHIYKTYKCLDHGFTMEQKSFTHNYYATNSAAPRHQNQSKFQTAKPHVSTSRPVNASPQPFNAVQPPWVQNQSHSPSQTFNEGPWPVRAGVAFKKFPAVPPPSSHNFYPLSEQSDMDAYLKGPYKCDPCSFREAKPRQSWTITNMPDFRALENMCHAEQRELYNQMKHKMDAELGKAPGQPIMSGMLFDQMQRRDMELKAKMIPLSHVEKTLIPNIASSVEMRGRYVQKNNSCGDTKEEADFFAAWGQMVQKEPSDFITHHSHNVQIPSSVVSIPNNISGPVQFIDPENDEYHEMSKVYMKPGSYKVPIKPADPTAPFIQGSSQEGVFDNPLGEEMALKIKPPFQPVTLAPQPKYNHEAWPCLMPRRGDDLLSDEHKLMSRPAMSSLDIRHAEPLEILTMMTSDRAWEAAKQSAPKLVDFIHEGSKSDTARLYDALGLSASDDFPDDLKQVKFAIENSDSWAARLGPHNFISKEAHSVWENSTNQDQSVLSNDSSKFDSEQKSLESDVVSISEKKQEPKETRCPNYDQSGNYIRGDNQKKPSKAKVAASGMWYHPKKKKPLPSATVKKFEALLGNLAQLSEAAFIQHDMDIKVAPRFYEVVKYPMCLHDISTKLKNSSYTEHEQVVQDFRRIFNNVRLYLKSYPDAAMKKNLNKTAAEFEKLLNEEFQNKWDSKSKCPENQDSESSKKDDKEDAKIVDKTDTSNTNKKPDSKNSDDKNKL